MSDHWMTRYTVRPATLDDAEDVCRMCNAWSMAMRGIATHDPVEERLDWASPGYELETDSRVAFDHKGALVGYASVWDAEEAHVRVGSFLRIHPDHEDASLRTGLADWIEERAREAIERAPADARVIVAMSAFSEDARGAEFLRHRGFSVVRHFVRLRITMDEPPPPPQLPEGIRFRSFDRDRDLVGAAMAMREAFRDHWGHIEGDPEEDLAQWRHWVYEDPDFDPAVWHLAVDGDEIVGGSFGTTERPEAEDLAYIYVLGVRKAWRGRGIARALLRHSFRTFYERGRPVVDLDADAASLTGAMRLYGGVGMRTIWRNDAYEKELRPGRDLSRRTLDT
jgi:ribosomal protein S18 acetylase RimI-like enzyme